MGNKELIERLRMQRDAAISAADRGNSLLDPLIDDLAAAIAALEAADKAEQTPVAWAFDSAQSEELETGAAQEWFMDVSTQHPGESKWVRNVEPLFRGRNSPAASIHPAPPAPEVLPPAAWVTVPQIPTKEMVDAFNHQMLREFGITASAGFYLRIYAAIIEAAPHAEWKPSRLQIVCREFIDDWRKGDFSLPQLAELDAQSMEAALVETWGPNK